MLIVSKKDVKEKTTAERRTCTKFNLHHSTIAAMTANKRMRGSESPQQNEENEQESSDKSELDSSDKSENEDDLINIGIPENSFDRIYLMYHH